MRSATLVFSSGHKFLGRSLLIGFLASFFACDLLPSRRVEQPSATLWPDNTLPLNRVMRPVKWDSIWAVDPKAMGAPETLTIGPNAFYPYRIRANSMGEYVLTYPGPQIIAYDLAGKQRWVDQIQHGSAIKPAPRDIELIGDSTLVVVDAETRLVTWLRTLDGALLHNAKFGPKDQPDQIAPIKGNAVVVWTLGEDIPFFVLDTNGRVMGRHAFPWSGYGSLTPIARQGITAGNGRGQWVFGFTQGDGWFGFSGMNALPYSGRYVEHRPFPSVEVRNSGDGKSMHARHFTPCSACDIILVGDTVLVLAGANGHPGTIVDRYRFANGRYLDSYLLPTTATHIAVYGDMMYLIGTDSLPRVYGFRHR